MSSIFDEEKMKKFSFKRKKKNIDKSVEKLMKDDKEAQRRMKAFQKMEDRENTKKDKRNYFQKMKDYLRKK